MERKTKRVIVKILIYIVIILIIIVGIKIVTGYQIICSDNGSGMKIWSDQNLTEEKKEQMIDLLEDGEFGNCSFFPESDISLMQECEAYYKPVIGILNSNIMERNAEIKRLKISQYFLYVFIITTIIFVIREVILKRSKVVDATEEFEEFCKEEENKKRKKSKKEK